MSKHKKTHPFIKLLCLVLCVYLIVLSSQPCQENVNNSQLNLQSSNTQIEDYHADEDCSEDDCSPFCICSCCHISAVSHDFDFLIARKYYSIIKPNSLNNYQNPYLSNTPDSIWRPPKS